MKRISALLVLFVLLLWPAYQPVRAAGRINLQVTIAAGTPVHVWTQSSPYLVNEMIIQGQPGSSAGLVYVMAGIASGRTPASTNATDLTATLCAATSTVPGCPYSDGTIATSNAGIDVSKIWIDGSHSGDVVVVSFDTRD